MKRENAWKCLLPILCAALAFALLALQGSAQGRLQRTQRCLARNEEALQDIAQRFDEGVRSGFATEALRGIHSVQAQRESLVFVTEQTGIAPAGVVAGFYYSPEDRPLPYEKEHTLREENGIWRWQGRGDNRGWTGRMTENWFYFEASN